MNDITIEAGRGERRCWCGLFGWMLQWRFFATAPAGSGTSLAPDAGMISKVSFARTGRTFAGLI